MQWQKTVLFCTFILFFLLSLLLSVKSSLVLQQHYLFLRHSNALSQSCDGLRCTGIIHHSTEGLGRASPCRFCRLFKWHPWKPWSSAHAVPRKCFVYKQKYTDVIEIQNWKRIWIKYQTPSPVTSTAAHDWSYKRQRARDQVPFLWGLRKHPSRTWWFQR